MLSSTMGNVSWNSSESGPFNVTVTAVGAARYVDPLGRTWFRDGMETLNAWTQSVVPPRALEQNGTR
jgi:hypothetical protein